jgi:hypothetical protein
MSRSRSRLGVISLVALSTVALGAAGCSDDGETGAPNGPDAGGLSNPGDATLPSDASGGGPDTSVPADDAGALPDGGAAKDAASEEDAGADSGLSIWSSPTDGGGPTATGTTVNGTVVVTPAQVVGAVPPRFVGLSFEKSHLTDSFFTPSNAPLIAFFNLLGPSILRIGANSVDVTSWDAGAAPTDAAVLGTAIGTADVDGLAGFLTATSWKAIYAVGLKSSTPAAAVAEATYAVSKLGSSLYGLEVGNEIDLYGLSQAQAFTNWEGEADAIRAALPNAMLTGPATAGDGYIPPFAKSEASRISLLTQHYYRADGESAASTMAQLLTPDPNLSAMLKTMATAATGNAISNGFRIDECNSYYNHGAAGVSNAFGAALWILDFLFTNALAGSTGVNLHGGGTGQDGTRPFYYSPIEEADGVVTNAQPVFYGMLLFNLAGTGNLLATTASASGADGGALNFTAYTIATTGAGTGSGASNVVIVNKDAATSVKATVQAGKSFTSASALYLQAAGLDAVSGVTLAGAAISNAGAWSPGRPIGLALAGTAVDVVVPAASAVVVHLE